MLWFSTKALAKAGITVPDDRLHHRTQFLADLAKLEAAGVTPLCLGAKDTFAVAELFENTLLGAGGAGRLDRRSPRQGTGWDGARGQDRRRAVRHDADRTPTPTRAALSWDQATKKLA